jgi:serpin B
MLLTFSLCFCSACLSTARADVTDDIASIASGNNAFAFDMYGQLSTTNSGNLFLSPYSISSALAMTFDGARGQTAAQMAQAMHFPFGRNRLNAAFSSLSSDLDGGGTVDGKQVYDLSLANSLWGQTGFSFNPNFIQTLSQDYGAGLQTVDFTNAAAASDEINQWVASETANKIQNLFSPGDLRAGTSMVLVNAIYFKGTWASQFDPTLTKQQAFYLDSQTSETVATMRQDENLAYAENSQAQIVEIPYVGNNLSMVIILPREVDGLAALEANLTADKLTRWMNKLFEYKVSLMLPKFKLNTASDLTGPLQALGMTDAFNGAANFSGITPISIELTKVVHDAYVNVDETGTVAAGATGVVAGPTITDAPPTAVFRANHPFLFLIRDQSSGAILFMGRVTDPNSN